MYEKNCPPHLNIVLYICYLVKIKHYISYFYNALIEQHLHQA